MVVVPSNSTLFYGLMSFLWLLLLTIIIVLIYILFLSVMVAIALSRLAVVHNSAVFSERIYFALPWLSYSRRPLTSASDAQEAVRKYRDYSLERCCPPIRQGPKTIDPDNNDKGITVTKCAICLDDVVEGNVKRQLPCFHEFHRSCIDLWLFGKDSNGRGANRCPLCARKIVECLPSTISHGGLHPSEVYDSFNS